jgi:hypothetical protein
MGHLTNSKAAITLDERRSNKMPTSSNRDHRSGQAFSTATNAGVEKERQMTAKLELPGVIFRIDRLSLSDAEKRGRALAWLYVSAHYVVEWQTQAHGWESQKPIISPKPLTVADGCLYFLCGAFPIEIRTCS